MSAQAIAVRCTPTSADIRMLEAQHERIRPARLLRRVVVGFYSAAGVLIVGSLVYAIATHTITSWSARPGQWLILVFCSLVQLAMNGAIERTARRKAFPPFDPTRDVELRFDDAGIMLGAAGSRVFPWADVTGVEDVGDAFIIQGANKSLIGVPKRALPDGGAELWTFLYDRLVGQRGLIRSTRPQRLILNSSGLQRP